MSDLINRQDAIEVICKVCSFGKDDYLECDCYQYKDPGCEEIYLLRQLPSVRKKGKWLEAYDVGDCCYRCSLCGCLYDAYSLTERNYCPKCGADMRGGES